MRKIIILFILIILCSFNVFSIQSHGTESGENDNYYIDGVGSFNKLEMLNPLSDSTINFQFYNSHPHPIIFDDLNGDGNIEIVIMQQDGTISLFHIDENYEINFVDSIYGGTPIHVYSGSPPYNPFYYKIFMVIHDVDNTGEKKLIYYNRNDNRIQFFNYNGSLNKLPHEHIQGGLENIKCRDSDGKCLALITNDHYRLRAMGFNLTDRSAWVGVGSASLSTRGLAWSSTGSQTSFPDRVWSGQYENIDSNPYSRTFVHDYGGAVYDADSDGYEEFAFTTIYTEVVSNCYTGLTTLKLNSLTLIPSVFFQDFQYVISPRLIATTPHYADKCLQSTQPTKVYYDADNTYDLAIGYYSGSNTFKIGIIEGKGTGGMFKKYPVLFSADGYFISNVVAGSFFPSNINKGEGNSVCIAGFPKLDGSSGSKDINLLCASEYRPFGLFKSDIFEYDLLKFDISEYTFNVSERPTIYGSQMVTRLEGWEKTNIDEIVTPYGVFSIDYQFINDLRLEYQINLVDADFIPIRVIPEMNRLQLLGKTRNSLYGIDSHIFLISDRWSNKNAYLTESSYIEPCIDGNLYNGHWALNTSVHLFINAMDDERDKVSIRSQLYYGQSYEQDSGWSNNLTPNLARIVIYSYKDHIANVSTPYDILRISIKDVTNFNDEPIYYDIPIKVSDDVDYGYKLGDGCLTSIGGEIEEPAISCQRDNDCPLGNICINNICQILPSECNDNIQCPEGYYCIKGECKKETSKTSNEITNSVFTFSEVSGVPIIVLILIILGAISFFIIQEKGIQSNHKFPIILLISFFVLGVFTIIGLIGITWLILMLLFGISVISVGVAGYMKSRG